MSDEDYGFEYESASEEEQVCVPVLIAMIQK